MPRSLLVFVLVLLGASLHAQGYLLGWLLVTDGKPVNGLLYALKVLFAFALPWVASLPAQVVAQRYNILRVPEVVSLVFVVLVHWWACPYSSTVEAAYYRANPDTQYPITSTQPVPSRVALTGGVLQPELAGSMSWRWHQGKRAMRSVLYAAPVLPVGPDARVLPVRFWACETRTSSAGPGPLPSQLAAYPFAQRPMGEVLSPGRGGERDAIVAIRTAAAREHLTLHADPQCIALRTESSQQRVARLDQRARWQHAVFNLLVLVAMAGAGGFLATSFPPRRKRVGKGFSK
jgi:hypothetical protein